MSSNPKKIANKIKALALLDFIKPNNVTPINKISNLLIFFLFFIKISTYKSIDNP